MNFTIIGTSETFLNGIEPFLILDSIIFFELPTQLFQLNRTNEIKYAIITIDSNGGNVYYYYLLLTRFNCYGIIRLFRWRSSLFLLIISPF